MANAKLTRKVLEVLVKSGSLDSVNPNRAQNFANIDSAIQAASQLAKNNQKGQGDLFADFISEEHLAHEQIMHKEWVDLQRLKFEKETLGLYLSGHPIDCNIDEVNKFITDRIVNLKARAKTKQIIAGLVIAIRTLRNRKNERMAIVTLDDATGRQDVTVFGKEYEKYLPHLVKDKLIVVTGEVGKDNFSGGNRMVANTISDLSTARLDFAQGIKIFVEQNKVKDGFVNKLKQILLSSKDAEGCLVQIHYATSEAIACVSLPSDWKIKPTEVLISNLQQEYGFNSVEVCY